MISSVSLIAAPPSAGSRLLHLTMLHAHFCLREHYSMEDRDMLLAVKEIWNPETCACFTTENAAVIIAGSKIGMEIGMFQTDRRVDRDFYIMGWCAAGIFAEFIIWS